MRAFLSKPSSVRVSLNTSHRRAYQKIQCIPRREFHQTTFIKKKEKPVDTKAADNNTNPIQEPSFNYNTKDRVGDLIEAASVGDLERVKALVASGVPVQVGDYDRRTPLHLAAAEGHLEVVKYLIEQGADVHVVDRWGGSVMSDAVTTGREEVIRFLRSHGVLALKDVGLVRAFITAARENNLEKMKKLVEAGVDINCTDPDGRTALHVACAKGNPIIVEYLINNGARVNQVDAFSNTALSYSQKGESKSKREITRWLKNAGAVIDSDGSVWQFRNSHEYRASLQQCLPLLCDRGGFIYAEAWIPTDDESELLPTNETFADKQWVANFQAYQHIDTSFKPGQGLVGSAWSARSPVFLSEVEHKDLGYHQLMIASLNLKAGLAVPILYHDKVITVLAFFGMEPMDLDPVKIDSFFRYTNGLISSGAFSRDVLFEGVDGSSPEKMKTIYNMIVARGVFNPKHIYQEVDWFFRMGIPHPYFEMFESAVIANHIHCFMAAKKLAQAMGRAEQINVQTETEVGSLFLCPATYRDSINVERQLEDLISKVPDGHAVSLTYLCSTGTILPNGKHKLNMYILDSTPYIEQTVDGEESNIWKVASGSFLRTKTFEIRNRYQDLIREAVGKLAPIFRIHPKSKDGTVPVTLTFRHSQQTSFLLKFTEALKFQHLRCSRKFIETFANGLVVYSFYLQTDDKTEIDRFLYHIQLLSLVPGSSMINTFLEGSLSVEEYAYATSVRKFVYYFLNQRSEEFEVLAQALKDDTLNLGRLNLLQTKLRREAVSLTRITETMLESTNIVRKLYEDFEKCCRIEPKYNSELAIEIKKNARSEIDAQILLGYLTFNAHIRKTNFWKPSKAALSFSLDPSFVIETSLYPENPYTIFFVLGQEFQGFHIRFRDIARGGIRVIKSSHRVAFLKNQEGQFAENYDLALTQNKKNKDIPEFGSKGTVLLNRNAQGKVVIAFQKYIAGLLDLLVIPPGDQFIVDHYKREELLFLGPDENTADLMEWAAKYSQTRGYRYWKAFTTGKPPSIGGVPHDAYGMTTQSVHRYVLGCLQKLGLQEEAVTKVQTGGPDGDLGSNEILLSKDKTITVIDGSGVVFDPNGLDREELSRLANARKMVIDFDASRLSAEGFKVLITDTDYKLPSGELIETGLTFRNEFHLHSLATSDLFVPCGGRPASINLGNVGRFFDSANKPKHKIIVEGANLFLTQDARLVLENAGVILYKDASANKGGVTSSSLEVLAALSMTDEEHGEHMQVKDADNPPQFYSEYVVQIQETIQHNADLEFACIWREHERTGLPRCVLTDKVSEKINTLNDAIGSLHCSRIQNSEIPSWLWQFQKDCKSSWDWI